MTERSVDEIIAEFLEQRIAQVRTAQPARVVAYHADDGTADVQPLFTRVIAERDGTEREIAPPQVLRAPVVKLGGNGWSLRFQLRPGDLVLLVCAERALDRWLASDGSAPLRPGEPRRHALADAIVIPGLHPQSRQPGDPGDDFVVDRDGVDVVRLQGDGTVLLGEGASLAVARETDGIEVSAATAPDFYAHLAQLAAKGPSPIPPFTGTITGRITSGAEKVKA